MSTKEDFGILGVIIVFMALFIFIGYVTGYSRAERAVRQEAVDHHAASWECDQKDGMPHIKWHSSKHGEAK